MSFAFLLMTCLTCLICSRRVTRSSSAAPSQPTPTASFARRRLSSCSSWTACGRSSASFHAPLNLRRVFWCCSSNMPMLLSLAPFWGIVHLRGEPVEIGLLVPIQTGLQFKIIFIVHNLSFIFMIVQCRKYQKNDEKLSHNFSEPIVTASKSFFYPSFKKCFMEPLLHNLELLTNKQLY